MRLCVYEVEILLLKGSPANQSSVYQKSLKTIVSQLPRTCFAVLVISADRNACAIPDPDNEELIISGGTHTMSRVSVYREDGWVRDLASLGRKRRGHGCAGYTQGGKKVRGH